MGKKSPSAPAAPNPVATAQAQSAANAEAVRESAKVNQINQVTPYGSSTWSGTIGQPDRTQTETLNPADQANLERERALAAQLTGLAQTRGSQITSSPFSLGGLPEAPMADGTTRQRVEDALYKRSTSRLDPQFLQGERDFETQMATRGIPVGSEAYNLAKQNMDRAKTDAYGAARDSAIAGGGSEETRSFGLAQSARQQGISDRLLERQQPMNELAALLQGSPALGTQQFGPNAQYQVAPPDILGATQLGYQAQQNAYNQQMQSNQATQGGLFGLAGAGISAGAFLY